MFETNMLHQYCSLMLIYLLHRVILYYLNNSGILTVQYRCEIKEIQTQSIFTLFVTSVSVQTGGKSLHLNKVELISNTGKLAAFDTIFAKCVKERKSKPLTVCMLLINPLIISFMPEFF